MRNRVSLSSFATSLAACCILWMIPGISLAQAPAPDGASTAPVTVDLFTMSQCPWGTLAESTLHLLKQRFGDRLAVNVYYIAAKTPPPASQPEGAPPPEPQFRSLHGPAEVEENMRQLVIAKHFPRQFWDYLLSRNTNMNSPEWQSHARLAGLDPAAIQARMDAGEGISLLGANIDEQTAGVRWKKPETAWVPPQRSPTVYVNNQEYRGAVSLPSLMVAINGGIVEPSLKIAGIPPCYGDTDCVRDGLMGKCLEPGTPGARCEFASPPVVKLTKIKVPPLDGVDPNAPNEERPDMILAGARNQVPQLNVIELAADSDEAKAMINDLALTMLPAYVFDKGIEDAGLVNNWVSAKMVEKRGSSYVAVSVRPEEGVFLDRATEPNTLEVYIMSQCPFGIKAVNQLIQASRDGKIAAGNRVFVHYIAKAETPPAPEKTAEGEAPKQPEIQFRSLHGVPEVEEDMRHLCIQKHFATGFADYLIERGKDMQTTLWEKSAIAARIDPDVVRVCVYQEGKDLLKSNIVKANEMGIERSPTFLWENQRLFLDAKIIKNLPGFENVQIDLTGSCQYVPPAGRDLCACKRSSDSKCGLFPAAARKVPPGRRDLLFYMRCALAPIGTISFTI